jgi:squalene synthase HpnC
VPFDPIARGYTECEKLARSHDENFPVASWLLPARMRPHVAALYAFARIADDVADEGHATPEERQARLQAWSERLHDAIRRPPLSTDRDGLVLAAVGHSIRSLDLPIALFDDLLSAFGQDTMTNRYDSWCEVLDYCRRSANPVGRLVLRIAGFADADLDRSSDALCTALQLTNFWQDFGRDWRSGRLYVPREVQQACGASERELSEGQTTGRLADSWDRTLEQCVVFTRARYEEGRAVCSAVGGRLGLELRLTWLGGSRVLDRAERGRVDLLSVRPVLRASDVPAILWHAVWWHR